MGAFMKKRPDWASFFRDEAYAAFVSALDGYFKQLGAEYRLGEGMLEVDESVFGHSHLGIVNLAQRCSASALESYSVIIGGYFDAVRGAMEFDREFEKTAHDFEQVKEYIGVRLYDDAYMRHLGKDKAVGRDIAPDLYAMVVFDLPQTVKNVQKEQPALWGKSEDELFNLGLENIRRKYPLRMEREDAGGFYVWHINNEHFFSPNIVFDMENHPRLVGSHGSIVGLPRRYTALVYPIEDLELVDALQFMISATAGMCAEGPGSLSSNIYWYKDGKLINLPYSFGRDKLDFTPPESFMNMVEELK